MAATGVLGQTRVVLAGERSLVALPHEHRRVEHVSLLMVLVAAEAQNVARLAPLAAQAVEVELGQTPRSRRAEGR